TTRRQRIEHSGKRLCVSRHRGCWRSTRPMGPDARNRGVQPRRGPGAARNIGKPTRPRYRLRGLVRPEKVPDRNGIPLDVFLHGGAARTSADVVERLGVLEAVLPAQRTAAGEEELFDVVAVGGGVVVAEER